MQMYMLIFDSDSGTGPFIESISPGFIVCFNGSPSWTGLGFL